ncbi:MAG: RagB/SusD family nutrient uptake outer membrane protein, partial [Bacteroides sp.]|nr:RagB/SusD family nutrient uptake outer membrane protein [Bacteroides sp.]
YILLAILFIATLQSCFDLTEEVFSELDSTIYYQDEASVRAVTAIIYSSSYRQYHEDFWYLQEFSADQVNWRSWNNGLWGYSDGKRLVISTHRWTPQAELIRSAWQNAWEAIGMCNSALDDFARLNPHDLNMTQEQLDGYIAEVRTLRAWDYYRVYELWGGALPLTTTLSAEVPASVDPDFDTGCKIIYDFMINELEESLDDLADKGVNRMSKATNRILKARLLLNAEVFIKENRFAECKVLCEEILDWKYGTYKLAADYRSLFETDNHTCEEVIMAFASESQYINGGSLRTQPFLPYDFYYYCGPFDAEGQPWNSTILAPSYDNSANMYTCGQPRCFLDPPYNDKLGAVYERFHDKDIRKQNYVFDAATKKYAGIFLNGVMRKDFGTGEIMEADVERDGQDLILVDQVGPFALQCDPITRPIENVISPRWGESNSGVRLLKYPVYPSSSGLDMRDPDEVEFRLAEVYFMLAECYFREGNKTEGKKWVDEVRQRYFSAEDWLAVKDDPGRGFTDFDLDWMLSQWGMEFLSEGFRRRIDLRRFDKFTQGQ